MTKKLTTRFWLALTIFSLVGQIAWVIENMYLNVFIYKMFNASAGDISLMVAASAVMAALTTLFAGVWSDKVGKRKIFMTAGYICWGVSILFFALIRADILSSYLSPAVSVMTVGISLVIIMDCIMTFFGSTANDAAFNAWLTDASSGDKRGRAEGINAMMPLLAVLIVFGGFMSFDLSEAGSWSTIFIIIGVCVIAIGILGFFIVDDTPVPKEKRQRFRDIFYGFYPSVVKENTSLYITLAAFAFFGISIQIFMPYLILYYTEYLGLENYVMIMAPAILLASVVTAVYGKVYDKKGFRPAIIPTIVVLMVGYVTLYSFTETVAVLLGSFLMMTGFLTGMAVFGAMIRDNIPENKAGVFQGPRICGQVLIPGVVGPYIGSVVLKGAEMVTNDDGTKTFVPNQNIFLAALVATLLVWLVLFPLFKKIAGGAKGKLKKENEDA